MYNFPEYKYEMFFQYFFPQQNMIFLTNQDVFISDGKLNGKTFVKLLTRENSFQN